jgi:RNA polymerase sigma-70 factor (ECF subfamily)
MDSAATDHNDAAVLRAARTDARAFEAFYERWAPPLHAWLRSRLNDPEAANDLTAETFAAALVGLGRFRGKQPGDGVAWLWGIARNLLHQHYRTARLESSARRRLGVSRRDYDVDAWDDVDARASAGALASQLAAAMNGLTPGQRRAIELRIVAELDFGVVAEHLHCNEPAARMRVSRALGGLRSRLQGAP